MTSGRNPASLEFSLNGTTVSINGIRSQSTLLDVIRARNLTGAKEGCAEGECGACMVLMVADCGGKSAYRAVNSCLMLAPMAAGREIYTVESLASAGELCEAQKAMAAAGGSQCGYCTPGFVVSLVAEQYRPGRTGPCATEALGGNLCRCTGYRPIADAARSLGPPPAGKFLERLKRPAPPARPYRWERDGEFFDRPATISDCVSIAACHPDARWIAGATDLAVESNIRQRRWAKLVSLEAVAELAEFDDGPDEVRIGAALPLTELAERWTAAPEIVRQCLPLFGSPAIRNRATLGGNLATASPIGDGAPVLLALGAVLDLIGPGGPRVLAAPDFFNSYRKSALLPGELIAGIRILKPLPSFARFYKVAKRRMDDISTVAAGFAVDFGSDGCVSAARLALGGVAATPVRVRKAEDALLGHCFDRASVHRAQTALDAELQPLSDHRGSAEYRREVAKSLLDKFIWEYQESLR
jgi:xanthine dehydrogenase small subunit